MANLFLKAAVRLLFIGTTHKLATNQAQCTLQNYMRLADGLTLEAGCRPVEVPPMPGIDEDMRRWSFYMILAHNTIVNRSISTTIGQLVRGEPLTVAATIDFKKDVMPSRSAGEEQLQLFRDSVMEHIEMVKFLGKLRGTKTAPHPIFGDFDAHKWNCMFSFHLRLHYKQAAYVVRTAKAEKAHSGNQRSTGPGSLTLGGDENNRDQEPR
ncbi:MAG: hypothetical protein V2J65_05185 [Desulfobacteraceae bacterium]|jgi:hypothetical protein|nr:hypothetical protein [Desulfobacteraceae bacterium]